MSIRRGRVAVDHAEDVEVDRGFGRSAELMKLRPPKKMRAPEKPRGPEPARDVRAKRTPELIVSLITHNMISGKFVGAKLPSGPHEIGVSNDKNHREEFYLLTTDTSEPDHFFVSLSDRTIYNLSSLRIRVDRQDVALNLNSLATTHEGQVDAVVGRTIIGWAWRFGYPDDHVVVELLVDNTLIDSTVSDIYRDDLDAAHVGRGDHGFELQIPPGIALAGLDTQRLRIQIHGTHNDLSLQLPSLAAFIPAVPVLPASDAPGDTAFRPLPEGIVRSGHRLFSLSCRRNVLEGWIANEQTSTAEQIEVVVDGLPQWRGLARRLVPLEQHDQTLVQPLGFRVVLAQPERRTHARLLEINGPDGKPLLGGPFTIPYGDEYIGFIEKIARSAGRLVVSGWCIDTVHPSQPVALEVEYEGRVVAVQATSLHRADLSAVGFDAPFSGFSIEIAAREPQDIAAIFIRPGQCATPLPRWEGLVVTEAPFPPTSQASADETPPHFPEPDDPIEGTIDQISGNFIRGWARNARDPEALVVLDCYIDGILFATVPADRFRADLKKHFEDDGRHEYIVELSPTTAFFNPGRVLIAPRVGLNKIKQNIDRLDNATRLRSTIYPRDLNFLNKFRIHKNSRPVSWPHVSIIVVNRNGGDLLNSLFSSFFDLNTYEQYEFIVIDHQSTDQSKSLTARWTARLNISWVDRDDNYSFSNSNNVGASLASGEVLLFLNNDITFTQDVLVGIASYLANPEIGCVGIKLFDDSPVERIDLQRPIQHLGIHFGPAYRGASTEAFESRYAPTWLKIVNEPVATPAVTGAFLACRRSEFLALGGFDERYFYGVEDVDLCLKYLRSGSEVVCANDLAAAHLRGYSRTRMEKRYNYARERNKEIFNEAWGFWLRRKIAGQRWQKPGFWTASPIRIAFAVTEANEASMAGDYFTALELAGQLSAQFPCECTFLEVSAKTEYQLAGFDVLIAMRDDYDPRRIKDATPSLIRIGWVRNWFDRFAERDGVGGFDAVWASSRSACDHLADKLGKPVFLLPIATNAYRFAAGKPSAELASDYCFTGSYWGLNREIVQHLDPAGMPFELAIFGRGWEAVPHLARYSRGPLPYKRMPDVYASTRIVIDDANHVTKSWGAVNSRVFDALCAGALVITNGKAGADELFEGLLPTFDSPQALQDLLWLYLGDEPARQRKVAELQKFVLDRHTYQKRSKTVWAELERLSREQLRIAIKIGAPNDAVRNEWGDYHFAVSMKYYIEQHGHSVRIDCLDQWYAPVAIGDDAVIVLRGLTEYRLTASQINIMWNISHPDKISAAEYKGYDHVFVASEGHTESLRDLLGDKVASLLQCTDPRFFNPDVPKMPTPPQALFVGNSRNVLRKIIGDGIAAGLPLEIYGTRWEGLIPDSYVRGENIPNKDVGAYYRSAQVLLNDHWDNMRDAGFISNRLFDAAACGARAISDNVAGLAEVFGDLVATYTTADDLATQSAMLRGENAEASLHRDRAARQVIANHSFGNRTAIILATLHKLIAERTAKPACRMTG